MPQFDPRSVSGFNHGQTRLSSLHGVKPAIRNKTPKRRVSAKLREDRTEAQQINESWATDFVHDRFATGRKIRVLTIVDTFSRFSPAVDPRFSYRGEGVVLAWSASATSLAIPKNGSCAPVSTEPNLPTLYSWMRSIALGSPTSKDALAGS